MLRGRAGVAASLVLGLALSGCATDGQPVAGLGAARGAGVAFESIDGPPVAVFDKLVADLSEEARSRQVMVVPRASQAAYRVRGYLAVEVERGRPRIGWVWDVYDADRQRALRISGSEPARAVAADAWAAADDEMLRRIARVSMERLAAFLAAPSRPAPGAPPSAEGVPVAAAGPAVRRPEAAAPRPSAAVAVRSRAPAAVALAEPRP
jgi:hypothetical protein